MSTGHPTVVHAFMATVDARRDQPLITFYDDATGERTELSGATLANWVAKTANLLVDGLGLGPGQVAAVRLPPHWQTAAVLLGCWAAGLTVDLTGDRRADVAFVAAPEADRAPLAAPEADRAPLAAPDADEVYALALDPLGQPFRPGPPPGTSDFIVEMRPHGDRLPAVATTPDQVALADGTRHAELLAQAQRVGLPGVSSASAPQASREVPSASAPQASREVPSASAPQASREGARVLIDADAHPDPVVWLVAPLLAGASVVVCRHLDPTRLAARLATERAEPFPPAR